MRRAVWRARPDDPKTPLGWFLRGESLRRLPLWAAFLATVAIGALTVGFSPWALVLLPLIALHVRHRPRLPLNLDPLVTQPAPGPSFRCRVEIDHEGKVALPNTMLGEDDGVLTFVDGWLVFAGRRTEFSFRPVDVEAKRFDAQAHRLALRDGGSLAFTDWEEMGGTRASGASEFRRAFHAWHELRLVPEGEPILPPNRTHPSGLARAWRGVVGVTTLGFLVMFAIDVAFPHSGGLASFVFVAGYLASFGRLKTLRRLAREERRALANEKPRAIGP